MDPGASKIARGIIVPCSLSEQGCQAFRQRGESRILSRELFGCGAEKSQTRNQFQGVGPAAHEIFDADPADKLFAHRSNDFFVAPTQDWIAQVLASLAEIPNGVGLRGRRMTEAFDLGEYVPDPVTTFAASPNFRKGRVVADRTPGLSFVKSFQRHPSHSIRYQRSETRNQSTRPAASCLHAPAHEDRKSTRLNSSHTVISYAVFC